MVGKEEEEEEKEGDFKRRIGIVMILGRCETRAASLSFFFSGWEVYVQYRTLGRVPSRTGRNEPRLARAAPTGAVFVLPKEFLADIHADFVTATISIYRVQDTPYCSLLPLPLT